MKVYFEESGYAGGAFYKDKKPRVTIRVYVNPTGDGHAYQFSATGEQSIFAWVSESRARVYDSEELPSKMWQSIQYGGCNNVEVIADNGGYKWDISDIEYTPVKMTEIKAFKEVCDKIGSVSTLDEFKALYPLIKKSNRLNMTIIKKLFSLTGEEEVGMVNGELGFYFFRNSLRYRRVLAEHGIE